LSVIFWNYGNNGDDSRLCCPAAPLPLAAVKNLGE